ncbi:MAG: radical SAM protein [Erysipelotrichaceae bacterium]|nr:radical SAM protein [Erysipelotrichaceae bacterium]
MVDRYKVMQRVLKENTELRHHFQQHPDLRFLFFEVTTRCNLACLHCGSSCTTNNGFDMPSSYIIKTIQSVKKHCQSDLPMLCITGGEPLLYKELTEVMIYASKLGFTWGMTTNATLINEQKAMMQVLFL